MKAIEFIDRHSPALKRQLERHPEWSRYLLKTPETPRFDIKSSAIDFMKQLREFKYKQFLNLGARHLNGELGVEEFTAQWSKVADTAIQAALDFAVRDNHANKKSDFEITVIGVGKLGSNELNLSSDVDLIFVYNKDNELGEESPSRHEIACKIARQVTHLLTTMTEDGFVFRVDNNLRPEGGSGPLANSLEAMIRYYEIWGHGWERQALLRARPVAGSLKLGEELLREIRPFCFSRSLDLATLSKIKEMKEDIQRHAKRSRGPQFDVKHGDGGIREAEFIAQTFQMTHGGTHPSLRQGTIVEIYDTLNRHHLMPKGQTEQLSRAYLFLRRLEHMIQIVEERQTFLIPKDAEQHALLAERMSLPPQLLERQLDKETAFVRNLFVKFLTPDYEKVEMEEAISNNLATCKTDEEIIDSLAWFKNEETNKLKRTDKAGKLDIIELTRRLTLIAEVVIDSAYQIAKSTLIEKYGEPITLIDVMRQSAKFAVIGMGKMGGRELDYGSDLDIIFIFSGDGETDGKTPISNQEFFTKLAQRISSLISLPTRYGRAFTIDANLRPSGRSGALVTSFSAFQRYHAEEAALWEHQALLKARPLAGDISFGEQIDTFLDEHLLKPLAEKDVANDIVSLRQRIINERSLEKDGQLDIKFAPGGVIDIEFLAQFIFLTKGSSGSRETNTFTMLEKIKEMNVLPAEVVSQLHSAYHFYRSFLSRLRLANNASTNLFHTSAPYASELVRAFGFESVEACVERLKALRSDVWKIYQDVLKIK